MRILYQLTSPMEKTVLGPAEVARRREFLRGRAGAASEVEVWSLEEGPPSIESAWEAALVVPELSRKVVRARAEGFDAVIVGCFSDPGLDALRELVDIPVVGPGASAVHLAAQLGTRFSVIAPFGGGDGRVAARLRALGVADKFASVRGIGLSVLDLARDREAVLARVGEVARAAAREDGADVFVLGCMSMGFVGVSDEIQQRLGLPVVNPVVAALKTAELMVAMGLAHSKAAYPVPPKLSTAPAPGDRSTPLPAGPAMSPAPGSSELRSSPPSQVSAMWPGSAPVEPLQGANSSRLPTSEVRR